MQRSDDENYDGNARRSTPMPLPASEGDSLMEPPPYEGSGWYEDDGQGTPCAPYPNKILILGGFRYLHLDGNIQVAEDDPWRAQQVAAAEARSEDSQSVVGGRWGEPVYVNRRTRAYWESRAAVSGHTLDELLASG
jgi:hypothetical protein